MEYFVKWTFLILIMCGLARCITDDLEDASGDGSDEVDEFPNVPRNSPSSADHDWNRARPYAGNIRSSTSKPDYNEEDFEDEFGSGATGGEEDRSSYVKPVEKWSDPDDVNFETPRPGDGDSGRLCPGTWLCLNDGMCFISTMTLKPYCQCKEGFIGEHCQSDDVLITEPEEPEVEVPEVEASEQKRLTLHDIIQHPVAIAVIVGAGVLVLAVIITLLVCCCLCIRKKDEGSYALDAAILGGEKKIEYTKVPNQTSQEFYA